jgi:cellobiose phosphorylase
MTQYGFFDDENREYVITNPKTPVKWINYIGTLAFGGFVDHTGGALICCGDPSLNRITRYIAQLPASDPRGEMLYLRVRRPEGWVVFSPFFTPTLDAFEQYECRVGLGYTRIVSQVHGVRTEVRIFVPNGQFCELRDIQVTNVSDAAIELDVIPVVEYTHPDALKQFTNADWVPQTMQSQAVWQENGRLVLLQYPFMLRDTRVNYFTSNLSVRSFETDRARFLGDHEYGTWARPLSLQGEDLSNYEARRGDVIAALLHGMGTLEPGESRRLIVQLGQAQSLKQAQGTIDHWRVSENVDAAWAELARIWDERLHVLQVKTPDAAFDRMVNVHNPHQCAVTRSWSRYLSLYQLGLGTRGIGFRDSSQDLLAVLAAEGQAAKPLIRQLLGIQLADGSAMHQLNPLSMIASEGDSLEREDRPHYYCDDHLWIVQTVCLYLKETADWDFLQEEVGFYNRKDPLHPVESGTVWEHLQRALAFSRRDVGAHGLPKLGFADWNDTINLPMGAESVMAAALYGRALLEMKALAQFLGDQALAEEYQRDYEVMKERVNAVAWDGAWYVSYFDADGQPLGSKVNRAGQIYAYGQAWTVLAGFAEGERARRALQSVYERLNTRHGIKLSTPGFNGFDPHQGGITTYPPGAKENGGIFLHVNPWAIIAETMEGNGERAYQYYCQINPAMKNDTIDEFESEPYVYPQNILGDEHPQFGLGRNSWLSGTASWAYLAATQYILGVRPCYAGLLVDPCIPAVWDGFEMKRWFRGAFYWVRVYNPQHVCRGISKVVVDGQPIVGQLIAAFEGGEHKIEVWMG